MLYPPAIPASSASTETAATSPCFAEKILENGLHLRFYDQSNRYFGDYHRVRVVVEIELALSNLHLNDQALLSAGKERFGDTLTISKALERMGVPGERVRSTKEELLASYMIEVQCYLCRPEVPLRLLRAELANRPSASTILRMR